MQAGRPLEHIRQENDYFATRYLFSIRQRVGVVYERIASPSARVCICRYNTAAHVVYITY